ncbi:MULTISPECIES: ABC transporter substrate-binding protein [Haloferax]|uniref:Extracellular solute-binding protein n=2 Tax=Haloferax TaxID=2251 RepID=A0A6G1Z6Q1_9EURY|nr:MULTISPECIES: extracellular solute-binding protein [Haloferax]KAB1185505.1 extracellular solute-binding protein [Haloferax sp. CBA1149]MRW82155.1 extracellular solute-binding protein [Haloferax marinisediminis]
MNDEKQSQGGRTEKGRGSSRRGFLTAVGSAAAVATAGCLGGGDSGGSNKPIRYLTDRGDSKEVMDEIIAEFEEETGYTVEMIYTAKGTSSDAEMQKMVAAGNPPDLLFDTSTDAYRLQRDGVLAPVTSAVQDNDLPDPVNVGGDSYFAAAMVEPLMAWYRNDIYTERPSSWSEWVEAAGDVSSNESMEGYVIQSGQTNNADTQMTQYLWQNDVDIYSGPSDGIEVTLDGDGNREAAIETFEWVQAMAEHSPNGSGWGWGDAIGALQQENAAAIASVGGLPILTIEGNRPDLVEKLSPMGFPVPEGGDQDKWWAYMEGHLVRNDGQNTEGAQAFVDFFTQSSRFYDFVLSAPLFQFPPTREQLDAPEVTENEVIQQYPEVIELVRNNWDAFTTVLATGDDGAPNIVAADAYGEQLFGQAADQLLVGGLTPEETVDWLAEQLRGLQ